MSTFQKRLPGIHARSSRATLNLKKDIDVQDRHRYLKKISGVYETNADESVIPERFREHYRTWCSGPRRTKFTKWMTRKGLATSAELSTFKLETLKFTVSTRYNDLLRLAQTRHYKTCMDGWRGMQMIRYLSDPCVAIAFISDAAGHYMWRALIRLCTHPSGKGFSWAIYRSYGNTNELLVRDALHRILPLYELAYDHRLGFSQRSNLEKTLLVSPVVYTNDIVGKHVWCDHNVALDGEKHLVCMGVHWPVIRGMYRKVNL